MVRLDIDHTAAFSGGADRRLPKPTWHILEARQFEGGGGAILLSLEFVPLMTTDTSMLSELSLSKPRLPAPGLVRQSATLSSTEHLEAEAPEALEVEDDGQAPDLETLKLLPPPDWPIPNLEPERKSMTIRLGVLGLRGLRVTVTTRKILTQSLLFETPQRPFVEFDVGRGGMGNRLRAQIASAVASAAQGEAMAKVQEAMKDANVKIGDETKVNLVKKIQGAYAVAHTRPSSIPSATSPCEPPP